MDDNFHDTSCPIMILFCQSTNDASCDHCYLGLIIVLNHVPLYLHLEYAIM